MTYAFLGLGNMAEAIIRGMRASGRFEGERLQGYEIDQQRAASLAEPLGLQLTADAAQAINQADVIVLAVKPQTLQSLLNEQAQALKGRLVITIAAGKPISFYEGLLGTKTPIIRVMPSLLARVGLASSAVCANASVTAQQLDIARDIFSAVGSVHELPEPLFAAFSAIGGAAPAFTFEYIDALASAGVKAGLSRALAQEVAAQMTRGSAQLVQQAGIHPRQLMDQVCSPGGTTIEGVHALATHGFDHAVHEAVAAVIAKDQKLGAG